MSLKKKILSGLLAVSLIGTTILTGCSTKDANSGNTAKASENDNYPKKAMEFIAPGGAGGGWDLTIRTVSKVLQDTKLSPVPTPVTNRPGGGGSVNLAYMQEKKGSDNIISVYSSPLLLTNLNGTTELSYKDTTPLARLIADYAVFVVRSDSKYKTINDVIDALKKDPKSVKIGGASSVGSMDHIQFLMIAKAAGITNLKDIDYISFQEGVNSQLLGGHIDVLSTGLSEVTGLIESGDMRALAQTADHRVGTGVLAEIPTCKEQGIDGTFVNWRGLFGPPEMPEYAVKFWAETIDKMVQTPEWKKACERNGWDNAYQKADEFTVFLEEVNKGYEEILSEIGMLKK
ncbi:Bug family tripartite tricarboxylate transporter substrate binding protein [Paramaledivibacter caminithermalis]|jgi:putative tricarboxylic transport membrane protein|uniref:Putative tricarboxylic transport membrane protein n=1 Tax=Paramaledivibacter caminithermalis (strain DSM 15212 / CIP 107654 / DViRD3) TaxID=1121301 RepID=A0A1M6PCL1_PARC5|nr:tripartite tricarboxylate transporter substrate-binding protein [Paramaledivibacter caminithermalis]SHK05693.1 putative tricarboxylic transport membrane protein [Paramaledivibacter caminithermalis DSM 15212]